MATAIEELTLLAARSAVERDATAERIAALLSRVDTIELVKFLAERSLLALIGTRLLALSADGCGLSLRSAVEAEVRDNRRRSLLFDACRAEATAALEGVGIPALPLKGTSLAVAVHRDAGLRRTSDIDLLVPPPQAEKAVDVLIDMGYVLAPDADWVGRRPLLHYTLTRPDRPFAPPIELHWRIHWAEVAFSERLVARSRLQDGERRAELVDELTALLLFYGRDSFHGLRLALDIGGWWDRHGHQLSPAALDEVISGHPALARTLLVALVISERSVGLPMPQLVSGVVLDRAALWAIALADTSATLREPDTRIMLIDLLLSLRHDVPGFLRRYYLQPLDEVRRTYGLERSPKVVVAARGLLHAVGGPLRAAPIAVSQLRAARRLLTPTLLAEPS